MRSPHLPLAVLLGLLATHVSRVASGQSGPESSRGPASPHTGAQSTPSQAGSPIGATSTQAAAGSPKGGSAEAKKVALQKYTEGAKLAREERWEEAYPLFVEAWGQLQHWQIAMSLGSVEIELGKFRAAERHFSYAEVAAKTAEDFPEVQRPLLARLLARSRAELGKIWFKVTADRDAEVWLDGERLGAAPFSELVAVDPGAHRVEVRGGDRREGRSVVVVKGGVRDLVVHLGAPQTAGSEVEVVPPGPSWPLVIALGSTAVVGVAVGAGLWAGSEGVGAAAREKHEAAGIMSSASCKTQKAACDEIVSLLQQQDSLLTGATLSWIGGGLAAVGAVTVWGVTRPRAQSSALRLLPVVAPSSAGLVVMGSW